MISRAAHFSEALVAIKSIFFLTQTFRGGHMFPNTNLIYHGQRLFFFQFNKFVLKEGLTKINKLNTMFCWYLLKRMQWKALSCLGNIQT